MWTTIARRAVFFSALLAIGAMKLEAIVLSERLRHGGNPVLRWMASNVSLETDAADDWKPSKKKSRERIDGIVALIMGLERATTYDVYD
jgi:phage terminase large subunit-like protein